MRCLAQLTSAMRWFGSAREPTTRLSDMARYTTHCFSTRRVKNTRGISNTSLRMSTLANAIHISDEKGRSFYPVSLVAAGVRHGSSGNSWHGIDVTSTGNHWRYSIENLEKLDANGDIYWPPKGGKPRLKMYAEKAKGSLAQDWWGDIPPLNSQAQERLGYPTQKPEALLDRIVKASSNQGDLILDPFCGCGTAIAVAQ